MGAATDSRDTAPWVRVLLLLLGLLAAAGVAYRTTGSALPTNSEDSFLFQSALLMIVLGNALVEYRFTKPADSAVNSISGLVALLGVYYVAPAAAWWTVFVYCALVFTASLVCIAVSSGPRLVGWRERVARVTYRPAVALGSAKVLFSVLFMFGLLTFRSLQSPQTVELVLFWGLFLILLPNTLPSVLAALARPQLSGAGRVGIVVRTDWPDIVRVALERGATWSYASPVVVHHADGTQRVTLPLYSQPQGDQNIGTGICLPVSDVTVRGMLPGDVCALPADSAIASVSIAQAMGFDDEAVLLGFVVEDSLIGSIRFEVLNALACTEGMLVFCMVDGERVFYQITAGTTREEALEQGRHGFHVATAAQLGVVDVEKGFRKFSWLPAMNSPVFAFGASPATTVSQMAESVFQYGVVPSTELPVLGDFVAAMDHHTAILGVTGSGKTELAFELVRHAVAHGTRVVCIDLTSRYAGRLADLHPVNLSLSADVAAQLGDMMFEAETGKFGAGEEKKALRAFSEPLRGDVRAAVTRFLDDRSTEGRLGLITLEEISNTKATLAVTEMFMSCLLESARDRSRARERILVVLEEAHTVVPEASTMGLGDFDSKGMVAKIAQIALQGRKYGVGLLVLAQRTATVSKSILTQCNTVISFSCFDETSIGFLSNIFGSQYAEMLPNLRSLQAVGFGKGIRSERPILFEIPFDEMKKRASDIADGRTDEA